MTDILTRFVTAVESIAASLAKVPAAPAAASSKAANDKPATPPKDKAPAATSGGEKTPPKADAGKGAPAGTTKAAGGKHTLDQVRDMIRKVATTEGLGKPDAINILEEEGGVKTVAELKPENYDSVYEACEVSIANAGKKTGSSDTDDLM